LTTLMNDITDSRELISKMYPSLFKR